MRAIPLMRFGVFEPFVRYAGALDERVLAEAERAGLPIHLLDDPDMLIPSERVLHTVETFARRLGQSDFGWSVGQSTRLDELGTFGKLLHGAPTLAMALTCAAAQFHHLHSGAALRLEVKDGAVWLRHLLDGRAYPGTDQALPFTLALLLQLVRRYAGEDWRPLRSKLPQHVMNRIPADIAERERLSPSDVDEAAIAFDAALLGLPPDPARLGRGENLSWEDKPKLSADFVDSVQQVILSLFGSGRITARRVAETGQMSVRTFHRALEARDVSFGRMLDELKLRKAQTLLMGSSMRIGEIADLLGYAEPSNFNHAFRRWTGTSPSAYRARIEARRPS